MEQAILRITRVVVCVTVVGNNNFVRNEYLYFGRRTDGSVQVSSIDVEGVHREFFRVDRSVVTVDRGHCYKVKISFVAKKEEAPPRGMIIEASVRIRWDGGPDRVIPLEMQLLSQK